MERELTTLPRTAGPGLKVPPRRQNRISMSNSETNLSETTPYLSVDNSTAENENGSRGSDSSINVQETESLSDLTQIPGEFGDVQLRPKPRARSRRKSSWFSVLGQSYKARLEEFKRIFIELPEGERLLADYSCAVQKEILVQGRIYASQNYMCFYSHIFKKWETIIIIKWSDVVAITKQKTVKLIPNAVIVQTAAEKHSFTSLISREKTYKTLNTIWKNVMKGSPMSDSELYHYLRSDSFDDPIIYDDILPPITGDQDSFDVLDWDNSLDNDDIKCDQDHEGKKLIDQTFPVSIDTLFTWLFTNSKFLIEFHTSRGTTDIKFSTWEKNTENNTRNRHVSMTVVLDNPIGPKSAGVNEVQILHPCSKPGTLYSVDSEISNSGIPYAESFYLSVHYCLNKVSETETHVLASGKIVYRKNVFSLAKKIIEKGAWSGFIDFYNCYIRGIESECDKHNGIRVGANVGNTQVDRRRASITTNQDTNHEQNRLVYLLFIGVIILFLLNSVLYYKLSKLEEFTLTYENVVVNENEPAVESSLLKNKNEVLMEQWRTVVAEAIQLLKQTESSLHKLKDFVDFPLSGDKNIKR